MTARLCIVRPTFGEYSQTFVDAHVANLPAIAVLYGSYPTKPGLGLAERLASLAVARAHLSLHGTPPRRLSAVPPQAFRWFLRRHRIDVVLAEFGPSGAAIAPLCSAAGIPLFVHFHGYDAADRRVTQSLEAPYRALFATMRGAITPSRHLAGLLIALGAPESKVHVNACGVDATFFHGAKPAEAPPHFLAAGRFVDKKAPVHTLLAFRRVLDANPECRLTMAGDGPLFEVSRQVAKSLAMESAVHFTGVSTPAAIAELHRRSRAFVQHSLTPSSGDSEGLPVAVLEAMASGLPVISTLHGGIPEVVSAQEGLLVAEGDIATMAEKMLLLARDPALAAKLGAAGRRRIESGFSLSLTIGNLRNILSGATQ